ncbi:MAG: hypothetical protein LBE39_11855 [Flavobacteriaceae bacterium]|jgi:hypothetical protein|nr:hypothetical protein [Flavobacteriaceae bacterium]
MKNIITILALFFFSFGYSQALDTLNYLKKFEIEKAKYIGKPFSALLKDMTKIQPKTMWPVRHGRYKTFILGNSFKFCDMKFSFHNAIVLSITWQDTVPMSDYNNLAKRNGYYFTDDEREYYSDMIIKDIQVYR